MAQKLGEWIGSGVGFAVAFLGVVWIAKATGVVSITLTIN